MLTLNKTLDPTDYDRADFQAVLPTVDAKMAEAAPQHPHRRWEYALALVAIDQWLARHTTRRAPTLFDVGGSGSPFWRMVGFDQVWVIDPSENVDLATHLQKTGDTADIVTCLSVLEHVDDLPSFLYHLSCVVKPGGLLVLTMDCCGCHEHAEDPHHFRWMRKRIFTPAMRLQVLTELRGYQLELVGEYDHTWHGPFIYDYAFSSLVLEKRAR